MGLLDWLMPAPPADPALQRRIEHTLDLADPLIRQASRYEEILQPAVSHALAYCEHVSVQIPGPFEVSRAAFAQDPFIHALFGSADDIADMLARSQCVREQHDNLFLAGDRCCAILGMRHREKSGFGIALEGNFVRSDVPQRTLYFTDHTLAEPSRDEPGARARLRDALYDGLLKAFAAHVAEVRSERDGLTREQAILNAQLRASRAAESHVRRLDALADRLRTSLDALQPDGLLEALAEVLLHPEPHLGLNTVTLTVDRFGVITGPASERGGDSLQFCELTARDQRRWVVILAHINQDEVREALARFESSRRYIVI